MSSTTELVKNDESTHFLQIDILKGLMILLVIIDHAIPPNVREGWGNAFWERISIPVFLVIMGFNAANSFKKKGVPLDSGKSYGKYVLHKLKRFLIPLAVLYVVSTIIGLIIYKGFQEMLVEQFDPHWSRTMLAYMILPFYGPGNWFIPVLFQAILILPLLYWVYQQKPKLALFLSFVWEVAIQAYIFYYYGHWSSWWPNAPLGRRFLQLSVLLYINALFIGFWIADHANLTVLKEKKGQRKVTGVKAESEKSKPTSKHWLFIGVVIGVILLSELVFRPLMGPNPELTWQATALTLLLVWTTIGLFYYRPLSEFAIVFVLMLIFSLLFAYTIDVYYDHSFINYYTLEAVHGTIYFFLSIVVFGIPYYMQRFRSLKNQNWFFWILAIMSGFYLCAYQYDEVQFHQITGDYQFLVYPHSVLIILLALTIIPKTLTWTKESNIMKKLGSWVLKLFSYVGKASYHILLTQMLMFGIMTAVYGEHYFRGDLQAAFSVYSANYMPAVWTYTVIMWLICVPLGICWYLVEGFIIKKIGERKLEMLPTTQNDPSNTETVNETEAQS